MAAKATPIITSIMPLSNDSAIPFRKLFANSIGFVTEDKHNLMMRTIA
jgi:hypothetical protein